MKKIDFRSPYVCMFLVVIIYIIKVIIKISLGSKINSVSLYSDGLHNLADAFEAALVIFAIYLSKQRENEKYPLGKSSIENIGSFLIGIAILFLAASFLLKSLLGLLIYFNLLPFLVELLKRVVQAPSRIDLGNNIGMVVIAVSFSVIAAWFFAWYEITTGRKRNHTSLVADGKETLADSFVELAVLIGVIAAYFGIYYLDLVFGLVVAAVMLKTAKGVLSESMGNLLQKSITPEKFLKIRQILNESKGIEYYEKHDSDRLMAFKLGKFIFVSSKVYVSPTLSSEGFYYLRKGIATRIKELFPQNEVRVYLKESVIKDKSKRALIPIRSVFKNKLNSFIEEDFLKAKSFFIVDLKGERIISVKEKKRTFNNYKEVRDFLIFKKIDIVYYVKDDKKLIASSPEVKFEKTSFLIFRDLFH